MWAAHSAEANATMIAYDNVFLLRPARDTAGFKMEGLHRPGPGEPPSGVGEFALTIYYIKRAAKERFLAIHESRLAPQLSRLGITPIATLVTEAGANTFPALPVRDGEKVLVSLVRLGGGTDIGQVRAATLAAAADADIAGELTRTPDVNHLTPTARSLLR